MREYVSGPAPVGYWRFEEQTGTTAYDLSGNFNTGTLANGPTWSAGGAVGGALKFDGVDDYINIGNNSSINITHPITIGAWVYPTGFNSYNTVIGKRDGASAVNYSFRINSNTTLEYYFADGSWRNFTTSYTFSANNWYYIAVTVNNSGDIIMYINGNNVGSFSTAFTPLTASNPLGIGSYHGDAAIELFKGIIDEVKIYNYARSARQIAYDYNGGKPVGHWKFDRGEGGTAYDASGQGNNGIIYPGTGGSNTATSTMWNNGVTGKINSAMDFDGTDDYVDIGSVSRLPTGSSSRTVSAWVYLDTTCTGGVVNSAGQFGIVTYGTYADSQMFGVQIDKATCELIFWGHTDDDFSGNQELTPYRWYHITSTFNGTTNKRYIDGVLDNQSTHSLTTGTTEGNIGRGASNEGDYFNGQIDDVRIYNYARTPEEVLIDYNGGAGVRF